MQNQGFEGRTQAPAPRLLPAAVQAVVPIRPQTATQQGRAPSSISQRICSAVSSQNIPLANSLVNHSGIQRIFPVFTSTTGQIGTASLQQIPLASFSGLVTVAFPQPSQAGAMVAHGGVGVQMVASAGGMGLPGGTCLANMHSTKPGSSSVTSTGAVNVHRSQTGGSTGREAAVHGTKRPLPPIAPRAPAEGGRSVPLLLKPHEVKPSGMQNCAPTSTVIQHVPGRVFANPLQSQTLSLQTVTISTPTNRKRPSPGLSNQASHSSSKLGAAASHSGAGGLGAHQGTPAKQQKTSDPEGVVVNIADLEASKLPRELMSMLEYVENGHPAPEMPRDLVVPPETALRKEEKPVKPKPQGKMTRKRKAPPDGTAQVSETGHQRIAESCLGSVPAAPAQSCSTALPFAASSSFVSQVPLIQNQQVINPDPSSFIIHLDHPYSSPCNISQPGPAEQQPELAEQEPVPTVFNSVPELDKLLSSPMSPEEETRVLEYSRRLGSEVSSSLSACSPSSCSLDSEMADFSGWKSHSLTAQTPCMTGSWERQVNLPQRAVSLPTMDPSLASHCLDSTLYRRQSSVPGNFKPAKASPLPSIGENCMGRMMSKMDLRSVSVPGKAQPTSPPAEQTPVPRRRNTVSGARPILHGKSARAEQAAGGAASFSKRCAEIPSRVSIPSSGEASPLPLGPDREHLMTLQKPQPRYDEPQPVRKFKTLIDVLRPESTRVDHGPTEQPRESPACMEEVNVFNKIPVHIDAYLVKPIVANTPVSIPKTGGISQLDLTPSEIIPQEEEEGVFSKLPEYHTDSSQSTQLDGKSLTDLEGFHTSHRRDSSPRRHRSSRRSSPAGSERHHKSSYSSRRRRSPSRHSQSSSSSSSWRSSHQRTDEEEGRRQIHIQPLPHSCDRHMLEEHFRRFGEIKKVKIFQTERDDKDPYAFVTFSTNADATRAVEDGKYGDFRNSTIGYGGRRGFCLDRYEDIDYKHAVTEDRAWSGADAQPATDYSEMLKSYQRQQERMRNTEAAMGSEELQ